MTKTRPSRIIQSLVALVGGGLLLAGCAAGPATPSSSPSSDASSSGVDQDLRAMLPAKYQQSGVITVGGSPTGAPFTSTDTQSGNVVGIAPDLALAAGKLLGVQFQFKALPYAGLITALQAHQIDIVWSAQAANTANQAIADWVPYLQTLETVLVATGNPANVNSPDDLCGLTVLTVRGSFIAGILNTQIQTCQQKGKPTLTVDLYDSVADTVTAFLAGKGQAIGITTLAGGPVVTQSGGKLEMGKVTWPADPAAIGFNKDEKQLGLALQATLKKLITDGAYDQVLKSYGQPAEDSALTADQITYIGQGQ